ncbi:GNAT family N-acetyltransferase [Chryseomicrobium excrementi]|uniref:GNAT family N-acetyltransferase n=1 Tax=Chryseomicrobium excrementi TaxID=2041346 RepID=A0A2M9EY02_9BACL|nr:GNAT family N-acetyltransferase [Chryseomicrobium excrementi]PJK16092.1 GNAT family N-acetyltransferase [Chryseomicrobium excrementi]
MDSTINAIFESERCYTRRFTESDLDAFIEYRNNAEWMKYQSFKGLSLEEYKEILLKETTVERGVQFAVLRKADQVLLGDVFIKKEDAIFWIGYTISPSFKRQGYAYEITQAMISWIQQQGDYKIMAGVTPENHASVQLLEKLGFIKADEEDGESIFLLQ